MCCNKGRQQFQTPLSRRPMPVQAHPPERLHGRLGARPAAPVPAGPRFQSATAYFEYFGKTGLTVVSPTTGKQYRFNHPGARVEIDASDGRWLGVLSPT